ncbi:MAG: hypothetical protein JWO10_1684 [Microbacteriaceae bacterium]|jgi:hypothetical protein|nr:hypothetical protein [Microbacteriaceae bacterium]
MQLGTRWNFGAEPPSRLDADFIDRVRAAEAGFGGEDTTQWRWTLTWLEGRPVAELDATGTVVR